MWGKTKSIVIMFMKPSNKIVKFITFGSGPRVGLSTVTWSYSKSVFNFGKLSSLLLYIFEKN